jgi:hypothetical protein
VLQKVVYLGCVWLADKCALLQGEENAEDKIKALDEMHQKYKFMEASLDTRWVYRIPSVFCIQ